MNIKKKPGRRPLQDGQFRHAISRQQRERSIWWEEYACWVTPEGLSWIYTDDPNNRGVSWRDDTSQPIAVSRAISWLTDEETTELSSRPRPRHDPIPETIDDLRKDTAREGRE